MLCNEGWDGFNDWINKSGKDCRNHQLTINTFLKVDIALCILCLIILCIKSYNAIIKQNNDNNNNNETSVRSSNSSSIELVKWFSGIPSVVKLCILCSIDRCLVIVMLLLHVYSDERIFAGIFSSYARFTPRCHHLRRSSESFKSSFWGRLYL